MTTNRVTIYTENEEAHSVFLQITKTRFAAPAAPILKRLSFNLDEDLICLEKDTFIPMGQVDLLIVEDDPIDMLTQLEAIEECENLDKVVVASSGLVVDSLVKSDVVTPWIVLLDLDMENVHDIKAACKRTKERFLKIPEKWPQSLVIGLSAWACEDVELELRNAFRKTNNPAYSKDIIPALGEIMSDILSRAKLQKAGDRIWKEITLSHKHLFSFYKTVKNRLKLKKVGDRTIQDYEHYYFLF